MLSTKECQVQICLQKINRDLLEQSLSDHNEMLSCLDGENEKRYRETLTVLREARGLNAEVRLLNEENGRKTAKHVQLQHQCADASHQLDKLQKENEELKQLLNEEQIDINVQIREYENVSYEIVDKFREYATYFDEQVIEEKCKKALEILSGLEKEEMKSVQEVSRLREIHDGLKNDVPEDILSIVGETELDETLIRLTSQCEELRKKKL